MPFPFSLLSLFSLVFLFWGVTWVFTIRDGRDPKRLDASPPDSLFFLSPLLFPNTKERLFPTPCVLHTCEGTPDGKPDGSVSYTILDFKTDSPLRGTSRS